MILRILISAQMVLIGLVACAVEQPLDPGAAQTVLVQAWQADRHAVWEIDWPAAPIGGLVTVESWQAGGRYRLEILESSAPALVGQSQVFDGQTAWLDNRFDHEPPHAAATRIFSPVSDAFDIIERLLATPPSSAVQQESSLLSHGSVQKIELNYSNGDRLAFWLEPETGLPVQVFFSSAGNQAGLQARQLNSLPHPREGLFEPLK